MRHGRSGCQGDRGCYGLGLVAMVMGMHRPITAYHCVGEVTEVLVRYVLG